VAGIGEPKGKLVGVLGLSFKPNTDDLRGSPALDIIAGLRRRGIQVRAFDPVSLPAAKRLPELKGIEFAEDAYACARGAHARSIAREWNQSGGMNVKRLRQVMKKRVLCALRNISAPGGGGGAGMTHRGGGRARPPVLRSRSAEARARAPAARKE